VNFYDTIAYNRHFEGPGGAQFRVTWALFFGQARPAQPGKAWPRQARPGRRGKPGQTNQARPRLARPGQARQVRPDPPDQAKTGQARPGPGGPGQAGQTTPKDQACNTMCNSIFLKSFY